MNHTIQNRQNNSITPIPMNTCHMRLYQYLLLSLTFLVPSGVLVAQTNVADGIKAQTDAMLKAFNEGDTLAMAECFWESEETFMIVQGNSIYGYDSIKHGLTQSIKAFKSINVKITEDYVIPLNDSTGIHVVQFEQKMTGLDKSKTSSNGSMNAYYHLVDGDWKIMGVHESYLPPESN